MLAQVAKDGKERQGKELSSEAEAEIRKPIEEQFSRESSALFSSSNLWDDGVIEPRDTRNVLSMALQAAVAYQQPPATTKFGVFRM